MGLDNTEENISDIQDIVIQTIQNIMKKEKDF